MEEAKNYIEIFVPTSARSQPHWDKAICDLNSAAADDRCTERARESIYEVLKHERTAE
jgi:hypothetical protein